MVVGINPRSITEQRFVDGFGEQHEGMVSLLRTKVSQSAPPVHVPDRMRVVPRDEVVAE